MTNPTPTRVLPTIPPAPRPHTRSYTIKLKLAIKFAKRSIDDEQSITGQTGRSIPSRYGLLGIARMLTYREESTA